MDDILGIGKTTDALTKDGIKVEITLENSVYMKLFGVVVGIIIFGAIGYYLIKGTISE